MSPSLLTRRRAAISLAALSLSGVRLPAARAADPRDPGAAGLSHDADWIRQDVTLAAHPAAVYEALTVSARFDALTRLSDAVTLVTAPDAQPTRISPEVGGAFVLFGGYITGRHLDMLPGRRLVQAWRTGSWSAGAYSIASFALAPAGDA